MPNGTVAGNTFYSSFTVTINGQPYNFVGFLEKTSDNNFIFKGEGYTTTNDINDFRIIETEQLEGTTNYIKLNDNLVIFTDGSNYRNWFEITIP